MDGASKFVKGDAIAGVVIVSINLLAGITIGVLQQGLSISEAIHTFSILTIGDAIAAQLPAILISTATGILVTRSASTTDLGSEISGEMLREPRAPLIAGAAIAAIALVPGMPKLPFLIVGAGVYAFGRASKGRIKADLVRKQDRVRSVHNEIVVAPTTTVMLRSNDTVLTSKVKGRFVDANKFRANHVKVVTENSVVYLMGLVKRQEAQDATEIARTTGGVHRVVRLFEYTD
jgi:flagellar biosynthesis component FlhA